MTPRAEEIPVTYLNKGQVYTMAIWDTTPPLPQTNVVPKYRTYVRVSFDGHQQRARPGAYWQIWKEGRGSTEAQQRCGRLLAVEYVDPNPRGHAQIQLRIRALTAPPYTGLQRPGEWGVLVNCRDHEDAIGLIVLAAKRSCPS